MKGQYVAIESVTAIGLGIILAIGSITAFSGYKEQVMEQAEKKQARAVESRIISTVHSLRYAESGSKQITLPDKLGATEYTVALGKEVQVLTREKTYSSKIGLSGHNFSGTAPGGEVKIFKSGDNFTLRAN